eukprot:3529520-Amphidinium_carterae.1
MRINYSEDILETLVVALEEILASVGWLTSLSCKWAKRRHANPKELPTRHTAGQAVAAQKPWTMSRNLMFSDT